MILKTIKEKGNVKEGRKLTFVLWMIDCVCLIENFVNQRDRATKKCVRLRRAVINNALK